MGMYRNEHVKNDPQIFTFARPLSKGLDPRTWVLGQLCTSNALCVPHVATVGSMTTVRFVC